MNLNLIDINRIKKAKLIKGDKYYTIECSVKLTTLSLSCIDAEIIRYELIPAEPIASWFLNISFKRETLEYLSLNDPTVKTFWLALVGVMEKQEQETHHEAMQYIQKVLS